MKKFLLDLYCCQGGASAGYERTGHWLALGVDLDPQPRYEHLFHQGDALEVLRSLLAGGGIEFRRPGLGMALALDDFGAIHASPPCQAHTRAWKIQKREHPRLIAPTRELLIQTKLPYVIENVEEARDELIDPVMLCGEMFGLQTYRHRLFETNWPLSQPLHPPHGHRTTKMGRAPIDGEYMHIVGNFSGVERARGIMQMPWANRDGLREAIPPVYAEHVGRKMLKFFDVEPI